MSRSHDSATRAHATRASLGLLPDSGMRLAFMADFIESSVATHPPPSPCRRIAAGNLSKVLEVHAQTAKAAHVAEAESKAAKDIRGAMVDALRREAERLGYAPVLTGASPVHRVAMALTQPESAAVLRQLFTKMDKDGNGAIDSKEWGQALGDPSVLAVMRAYFGQDATLAEIGAAFNVIDVDGNGSLDFDELVGASRTFLAAETASKLCLQPEGVARLKALFDLIDTDGDRVISSKEWGAAVGKASTRRLMMDFFGGLSAKECGGMFKLIDRDGNGSLSFDEFVSAMEAYGAKRRVADIMSVAKGRRALQELFAALDADGNGVIDAKEWGKAVSKQASVMSHFFGGDDLAAIGKAFSKIDADGSGTLTWDEFESFVGIKQTFSWKPPGRNE